MKIIHKMKDNEKCLDCEDVFNNPEFEGHGGDPRESYEEGFHICGKKQPRIIKVNMKKQKDKNKNEEVYKAVVKHLDDVEDEYNHLCKKMSNKLEALTSKHRSGNTSLEDKLSDIIIAFSRVTFSEIANIKIDMRTKCSSK